MKVVDVAVAIVTYRSARLTIDCLRSIAAERSMSALDIRAIVVDNASEDAPSIAAAIAENGWWSWVTLVAAPKNGGFAYGNNVALQHACAEGKPRYLHMLNPDTIVRNGAIGALFRFLEAHREVGIAGSGLENPDGSLWQYAFRFPSVVSEFEEGLRFWLTSHWLRHWVVAWPMTSMAQAVDWVSGASMMIRWSVIDQIGGFDENYFLYFEETDFCLRARKAGFSTWYVPESRVMHIAGQSTNVTAPKETLERLPAYWFESRRRYFAVNHGVRYAMITDAVAALAHALGFLKRVALGRRHQGIPHFLTDLLQHSPLRPRNRRAATSRIRATRREHQMPEGFVWRCNDAPCPSGHSKAIADSN
jgi:N-acetylglucosaminyl-diphospho-decaprenol L-rhamnosyltransferase